MIKIKNQYNSGREFSLKSNNQWGAFVT